MMEMDMEMLNMKEKTKTNSNINPAQIFCDGETFWYDWRHSRNLSLFGFSKKNTAYRERPGTGTARTPFGPCGMEFYFIARPK